MTGFFPFGTGDKISAQQQKRAELPYFKGTADNYALPKGYQPVPIHVIGAGDSKDHLIRGYSTRNCPAISYYIKENDKTKPVSDALDEYKKDLFPAIKREIGFLPTTWE